MLLDPGGHTAAINKILFLPGDKELVTAGADKWISVWDVATRARLRKFLLPTGPGPEGKLTSAVVTPDGSTLIVAAHGRTIKSPATIYYLDAKTGRIQATLKGHRSAIHSMAMDPAGRFFASGDGDGTIRVWDVAKRAEARTLAGHAGIVSALDFSPKGDVLLSAGYDAKVMLWDPAAGTKLLDQAKHDAYVQGAAWSPDGKLFATGDLKGRIVVWSRDGTVDRSLETGYTFIHSLAFVPKSGHLVYGCHYQPADYHCVVLDLATNKTVATYDQFTNTIRTIAVSADGKLVAAAGGNNPVVKAFDPATAKLKADLAWVGRTNYAAGWHATDPIVYWGTFRDPRKTLLEFPLERGFRLDALDFAELPDIAKTTRGVRAGGGVELTREKDGLYDLNVVRGGVKTATLECPVRTKEDFEIIACWCAFGRDRAAVGTNRGLYLFDTVRGGAPTQTLIGHTSQVWAVAPSPDGRYLLSAGADQTLRVWPLGKAGKEIDPLLSVFVAGDEWIAWTPEGYYAASPGGERLMGWVVNNEPGADGLDVAPTFHPAERFRDRLYQPEIIKRLLEAGGVEKAIAAAEKATGKKITATKVADILPPKARILQPATGPVADEAVAVLGEVEKVGDHDVTSALLLVDGAPYGGLAAAKKLDVKGKAPGRPRWDIKLTPGRHRLQLVAKSAVSQGASEAVVVDVPGTPPPPKVVALCVGVAGYKVPALKLNYAAADARRVGEAFRRHGAVERTPYHAVEVKTITDAEATREAVGKGLAWLRETAGPDDLAVFFFSGHGERSKDGKLYLLPYEADADDLAGTCLSRDFLLERLLAIKSSNKFVILDACHSGAIAVADPGAEAVGGGLVRELGLKTNGIVCLHSSRSHQKSLESHADGQALFAKAVTLGLAGKEGMEARMFDGLVYQHELCSYVISQVNKETKKRQSPSVSNPGDSDLIPLTRPTK